MSVIIFGVLFWVNVQWAGVAVLNPYQSWWVRYSWGETYNSKGEWINLWKWPQFGHTDLRPFLTIREKEKEELGRS